MAEEKKSIFDLADKFGIDSPFGNDWVKEDFSKVDKPVVEVVISQPSASETISGYYNKDTGDYLGTDGIKNNKVYIADKVDDSKKGKAKFVNAKELNTTHKTFIKFAGVVNGESSGNKDESLALGTTIVNASKNGGVSIDKLISNSSFTKAISHSNYDKYTKSAHNNKYALLSAVKAFLYDSGDKSIVDLSKGALLWEGGELASKGKDQHKPRFYGTDIPTYHWDKFKEYWETTGKQALKRDYGADKVADISEYLNSSGSAYWLKATKANNYRLLLKSTAVFGGTMFFGKNTGDPRNADYDWKYLSIF